jgi:HK97 family phage major capsid protein
MARIKELRLKVKDGTATDEDKVELETLETEASAPDESEAGDEAKHLESIGKSIARIAIAEIEAAGRKDDKKGSVVTDPELGDVSKMTGTEKVKTFFNALLDNDKIKLDTLSGGVSGDGGFLVPQEYNDTFVEDRRDQTVMRQAGATQINVTSNTFNVPQLATRPKMYWTNELAAKSSTSASFTNITLTPYTLAAIMTASNQVLADARIGGNLIQVITRLMTQALAEEEDRAFFTGSGSGQPTGLKTYTYRTVSAGGLLTADKLIDALYTLPQAYRKRAAWFMNGRTIRVVRQLKDSQNRYLFVDALSATDFPSLLGLPVYEQNDLETTSIFLGDISAYWIADREGISVKVSDTVVVSGQSAFEKNFTAIRVEERVDGEMTNTRAMVEITSISVS